MLMLPSVRVEGSWPPHLLEDFDMSSVVGVAFDVDDGVEFVTLCRPRETGGRRRCWYAGWDADVFIACSVRTRLRGVDGLPACRTHGGH